MRHLIPTLVVLLLAGFTLGQSRVSAASGMLCTLTGKKVATCCCEQKNGKLYCTIAKKTIKKCCCKSDSKSVLSH